MGAGAERHVLSTESGQLGNPQARLDGDEEQRAVAPSDPGGGVGAVEEGLDLLLDEELHDPALKALARDGEHALTVQSVGRVGERDVAEERVECREARVSAAGAIAALAFKVVEELAQERGVEIRKHEARRGAAEGRCGKAQEKAEGISIGGHGVSARAALLDQAVGEEGLQERGEIAGGHGALRRGPVARSVASRRSSGTASMYQ